jgi:hypothetical protein
MALFEDVLKMYQQGMTDADIVQRLTMSGYSPLQISEAINQARVKQSVGEQGQAGMTPSIMEEQVPSPNIPTPSYQPPSPGPMPQQMPSPRQQQQPEYYYPYQYPTYEQQAAPQPKMETEDIEEIAEEIVDEKWQEIKSKISDVTEWKNYADKRIIAVEDRLKRIESSFDRLQISLLGKVQEYGQNIRDLGAEMNSMQNAFGKVLSPLVDNVKELGKLTEDLKKTKK